MQVKLSAKSVRILKTHLKDVEDMAAEFAEDDGKEYTRRELDLKLTTRLINSMIEQTGQETNIFEEYDEDCC